VPQVADVAATKPEEFENNRALMQEIQRFINEQVDGKFRFKKLQIEDLARGALHDGFILAWGTGIGKSIAAIIYSLLKVGVNWERSRHTHGLVPNHPVLLVAPENLHGQLITEWKRRFGLKVTLLDSQDTYIRVRKTGQNLLQPGFYLTSYTQLGMNKIDVLPLPRGCPQPLEFTNVAKLMHFYGVSMDDVREHQKKHTA